MAQVPRVVDGICTCVVCCHRVWHTEWDCYSTPRKWGPATLVSSTTIAGTCPSDSGWYQDTTDHCGNFYDQYVPIPLLCEDCADVSPTPPPTNIRPEPPNCCDTPGGCCKYTLQACWGGIDCDTSTWSVVVISAVPDVLCDTDGPWEQNSGDPCCYTRYMWTHGTVGGACDVPPDMSPPLGGAQPEFCCEETWCNCVYRSTWNCNTHAWDTPVLVNCSTSTTNDASPWALVTTCDAQTTVSALGFCD